MSSVSLPAKERLAFSPGVVALGAQRASHSDSDSRRLALCASNATTPGERKVSLWSNAVFSLASRTEAT